ncbi:MAG TPA: dephospho-CoA kinase [Terriglobales bacterium]|nr:dephospho-CoA kinase [Terriglobales bacterium]
MLRVALTGGIACGKSIVSGLFRAKGCVVDNADETARAIMSPGRAAWRKVVARFGRGILAPDRTIDRDALGRIIFADAAARRSLDAIVHPLVLAEQERRARRVERAARAPIFVSEAALTIEAGYARLFDKVVVVHCRTAVQLRRLMSRAGIGRAEARRRVSAQMPLAEKLKHADYAIDTSGSLAETVEQAERVYASLLQDADLKRLAGKTRLSRRARPGRS